MTPDDASVLRRLADRYETAGFLEGDPSWFMHQVEGDLNREATAFTASALSFGSRPQFMAKVAWILERANCDVDAWIRRGAFSRDFRDGDQSPFYRFFTYGCMHSFFKAYSRIMEAHGSLGSLVRSRASTGLEAVKAITEAFREAGSSGVVPMDAKSACKRICMFLRWMSRDGSPVDIGLWSGFLPKSTLVMPMDTHVVAQAKGLGLLRGCSQSMCAARRLTAEMAKIFPGDPLKGDFALFGVGVTGSGELSGCAGQDLTVQRDSTVQ